MSPKPASIVMGVVIASLLFAALLISTVVGSSLAGWIWIVTLTASAGLMGLTYSLNQDPWAALGAYASAATALFAFLVDKLNFAGVLPPVLALVAVAVPFYAWWRQDRRQVLALTIAYVLVAAIPIVLIEAATDYEAVLVTIYVLLAIGFGLVTGFRMNRLPKAQ